MAGRGRGPPRPGAGPRRRGRRARPAWWPRSPSWPGCRARWSRAAQCFGTSGGWRWRRWRTGCATRRSSRRRRPSTRPGAPRSAGWCRRRAAAGAGAGAAGDGGRLAAPPLLRGPGAGAARRRPPDCCWSWTTCSGATRRRWPSSRSAWAWPTARPLLVAGDAARRRPRRRPRARGLDRPDAGHRAAHRAVPRPAGGRRHGAARRGDLRAAAARRPTRTCCTRRPAASRCTSSRRCAAPPIPAARRCRSATSPRCCATGSSRRPRPPGRSPAWRRRSGTNFTLDLLTEASDLDADTVVRGGRRAVAAPDHARVRRRLRLLPRPAARDGVRAGQPAEALAAAPAHRPGPRAAARRRHRRGRGPARRAVRPRRAAGAGGGLLPAGGRRRGRPCSPTPRRSGCTRRRCRSSRPCPPGRDRDRQELAILEAMAAPLNARYGYSSPELQQTLERSIALAESLGRKDSTVDRPGRAVDVAVRPGAHRRRLPDGHPGAGPGRARTPS